MYIKHFCAYFLSLRKQKGRRKGAALLGVIMSEIQPIVAIMALLQRHRGSIPAFNFSGCMVCFRETLFFFFFFFFEFIKDCCFNLNIRYLGRTVVYHYPRPILRMSLLRAALFREMSSSRILAVEFGLDNDGCCYSTGPI